MNDFSKTIIEKICIHFIGNKSREEGVKISSHPLLMDVSLIDTLTKYFFSSFKQQEYYNFFHETNLKYNEVYDYVSEIFNDTNTIYEQSINLANHLYKNSSHPQIKSGEFYIVYFKNCIFENEVVDAIGLFKSENKDTFLKVSSENGDFELKSETGININKLDKGCIIFNVEKEKGYLVAIVDNTNKAVGSEAQYWVDNFLQIRHYNNPYFQTQKILALCKKFATEEISVNDSSKMTQADFLNKTLNFFKESQNFNLDEFGKKVFQGTKIAEEFQDYKNQFEKENNIQIEENFEISNSVVKKQSASYQSVIKLDNNFHIYVHGDTSLIQSGIDEDTGMNYYRFLYKEER